MAGGLGRFGVLDLATVRRRCSRAGGAGGVGSAAPHALTEMSMGGGSTGQADRLRSGVACSDSCDSEADSSILPDLGCLFARRRRNCWARPPPRQSRGGPGHGAARSTALVYAYAPQRRHQNSDAVRRMACGRGVATTAGLATAAACALRIAFCCQRTSAGPEQRKGANAVHWPVRRHISQAQIVPWGRSLCPPCSAGRACRTVGVATEPRRLAL